LFWVLILSGGAAGCAYLQYLGPPPPGYDGTPVPVRVGPEAAPKPAGAAQQAAVVAAPAAPIAAKGPAQVQGDAAMLPPDVPRVALVVAGLGDDAALYRQAAQLAPEISLAISPYGKYAAAAAAAARAGGHETLLLLPMPGLLAAAPQPQNQATLDWAFAQFHGYAGVTDAYGPAMGGGFMSSDAAKTWLMGNVARHGLFFIEGDPSLPPPSGAAGRGADIVIDAADGVDAEASGLAQLITTAQARHAALGIMLDPTPDALELLRDWSTTLVIQNILLVPASALVPPPGTPYPLYASTKP